MNSRQRRQFRRKWKHQYVFINYSFETFQKICNIDDWCKKRFGSKHYCFKDSGKYIGFLFDKNEHFVEFQLTWADSLNE